MGPVPRAQPAQCCPRSVTAVAEPYKQARHHPDQVSKASVSLGKDARGQCEVRRARRSCVSLGPPPRAHSRPASSHSRGKRRFPPAALRRSPRPRWAPWHQGLCPGRGLLGAVALGPGCCLSSRTDPCWGAGGLPPCPPSLPSTHPLSRPWPRKQPHLCFLGNCTDLKCPVQVTQERD